MCRVQNIASSERSLEPPRAGSSAARKVPGPALGQLFPTRAPASFAPSPYHHPQATTMPDPRPTLNSSWTCYRCQRASTEHHLKPKPSQLTIHYAPSPGEAPARVRCPSHQLSVSLCLDSSRLWLDREALFSGLWVNVFATELHLERLDSFAPLLCHAIFGGIILARPLRSRRPRKVSAIIHGNGFLSLADAGCACTCSLGL